MSYNLLFSSCFLWCTNRLIRLYYVFSMCDKSIMDIPRFQHGLMTNWMSTGHSLGEQDDTKSNFFTFFPSDLLVFSSLAEHSSSKKNVMKIWTENKENEITTPLKMDCDGGCHWQDFALQPHNFCVLAPLVCNYPGWKWKYLK